ncbi:type IV toxin-antitoxin system AbiEi family antitoxin domain-containing protein [Arthrobacter sp. OAP107]|uniref:type IV toxin-antitoxin system AbiEi family antitoxin domain-containing protein n=1 Tax=Arthrobacter sp. OAP107 TaxID=3156445 RepID=UPI00339B2BA9
MQPTEFLSRHGGAARLAHLRRAGFSRSQISQAVNSGLLLNARHAVYKLPQANCDFVRAYEANAAVTCVSAASHYSLWTLKAPTEPHLAACHRRLPRGVRSHRFPGARNGRARAVLDQVERGSDSLLETVARVLFRGHGFDVRTQVYLAGMHRPDDMLEQIRLALATPPRTAR